MLVTSIFFFPHCVFIKNFKTWDSFVSKTGESKYKCNVDNYINRSNRKTDWFSHLIFRFVLSQGHLWPFVFGL